MTEEFEVCIFIAKCKNNKKMFKFAKKDILMLQKIIYRRKGRKNNNRRQEIATGYKGVNMASILCKLLILFTLNFF